jgi:hypothetical protein
LVVVNPGASARGQPGPQVHQLRRGAWFYRSSSWFWAQVWLGYFLVRLGDIVWKKGIIHNCYSELQNQLGMLISS